MAIRLLVAVTVGIATLSLLVPLPENVADSDTEEVTVEPSESQVTLDAGERRDLAGSPACGAATPGPVRPPGGGC